MSNHKSISKSAMEIKMLQNVLLIWLDNNIDESKPYYRDIITKLRCIINTVNIFTDRDQCVDFLTDIHDEYICLMISEDLCEDVVPLIHDIARIDNIFIFCKNQLKHEQWAKNWLKINGVFTQISSICQILQQTIQRCENDAIPISFMSTSGDFSKKKLNQLEPLFMYSQIIKEILLTIRFERKHQIEFLEYCRQQFAGNDRELNNIQKFETTYRNDTAIWWYTYECFLYRMLNRALRVTDLDIIIKIGFYISDLHRQIKKLHNDQFISKNSQQIFTVYRGQGMSKNDFQTMRNTLGGLISFNNFLSTSKKNDVSLRFARRAITNPDMVGIVFLITVNPVQSTTPFASIVDFACYRAEDEILFAMHSVFRIRQIKPLVEDPRLFQVELTMTNENDQDLRVLKNHIHNEIPSYINGWYRLGGILSKMGQFDKSQQVYEVLLEHAINETEKVVIYTELGSNKYGQGKYEEAIKFYEKAIQICKDSHRNDLVLANIYNNVGMAFLNASEYTKAASSHEKSLAIQEKLLPPNHPDLLMHYNNIGIMYSSMNEYKKAVSYYEKVLRIHEQILPANHPHLAALYGNIGVTYKMMKDYSNALLYFKKTIQIQERSLPPNHPDLSMSYNNIGVAYMNLGDYQNSLSYYEKAFKCRQETHSLNHPDMAAAYNNMSLLHAKMGNYSEARSFQELAVAIAQESLPSNHPNLERWKSDLERMKRS